MVPRAVLALMLVASPTGCLSGKSPPDQIDGSLAQGDLQQGDSASHVDAPAGAVVGDALEPDMFDQTPTGKYCEGISGGGGGLPSCKDDSDCSSATYKKCVNSWCLECAADSDCALGPKNTGRCDSFHFCRRCVEGSECVTSGLGAVCLNERCRQCTEDSHCVAGADNTGKCLPGLYRCSRCEDDADCTASGLGTRCDPATSRCVECLTNGDCVTGKYRTAYCHDKYCDGCATDQDCVDAGFSGKCSCNADNPDTAEDEDTCPAGLVCVEEACVPQ